MADEFGNDTIFVPVFLGTRYKHHVCCECGYTILLEQGVFGGIHFPYGREGFRYCPGCGKPVARFSDNAIFEEKIDFDPLKIFWEAYEEYRRKCRWLYHVHISEETKAAADKLRQFEKEGPEWTKMAFYSLKLATQYKTDWRDIKKLKLEFGED